MYQVCTFRSPMRTWPTLDEKIDPQLLRSAVNFDYFYYNADDSTTEENQMSHAPVDLLFGTVARTQLLNRIFSRYSVFGQRAYVSYALAFRSAKTYSKFPEMATVRTRFVHDSDYGRFGMTLRKVSDGMM